MVSFHNGVPEAALLSLYVNWVVFPLSLSQGHPRTETPLTSSVSLYSDRVPNTSNQMFGSGLYTELGKELIHLDNLLTLTANHRKTKRNPEMQPCWGLQAKDLFKTHCSVLAEICYLL